MTEREASIKEKRGEIPKRTPNFPLKSTSIYTKDQQDDVLRALHYMAEASKSLKGTDEELYNEISNLREKLYIMVYNRELFGAKV